MKKVVLLVFVIFVVLAGIGITACSKGISVKEGDIKIKQTDGTSEMVIKEGGKTPEDFGDIPIYPGSSELMKISGNDELDGQPAILDHRMYSTTDSVEKVIDFYQTEMPANGWTEESWAEGTVLNMGIYNKNEKQSFAVVSVTPGDTYATNITIEKKYLK